MLVTSLSQERGIACLRRRDEGVTTLSVRRHLISASRLSDYNL